MASIGENAYGKNLTVENLTYSTLNPPIGGFVNNPLTGTLLGGGNNIDLQGGNMTTAQLNYTTLNPAISPGITNPLTVDLLCAGKNIGVGAPADKANEIKSVTGTFDNSALGVATGTTVTTTGAVTAGGSTYGALCNVLTGLTVGTGIVSTTGDIVATTGKVTAGANIVAGTDLTVGTNILAGTGIISTVGDIVATAGKLTCGANIFAGTHIVADAYIRSDTGNILTKVGNIYTEQGDIYTELAGNIETKGTGNITSVAGNIDSKVGIIQGQVLKVNNTISGGTTQAAPIQPPFATTPDMTGKSKGCFWVHNGSSALIQFIVETGIANVTQNASTFLTVNQFNTSNPRRIINYRIGQVNTISPDWSKLAISITLDGVSPSSDPVRVCLLVIPD